MLDNEKVQSASLKDDLVKQISALLLNFTDAHSRNLDTAMEPVLKQNLAGISHLEAFEQQYIAGAEASREKILRYEEHVNGIQEGYQTLRQEGHKVRSWSWHKTGHSLNVIDRLWLMWQPRLIVTSTLMEEMLRTSSPQDRHCYQLRAKVCWERTKSVRQVFTLSERADNRLWPS
jgi:hypothetical protein